MRVTTISLVLAGLISANFVGCGKKDDLPVCSSKEVVAELQNVIKKFADEQKVQAKVEFKDFTVQAKNVDQRKVVCRAKANGYFGTQEYKDEEVNYSAQFTEDNKLIVEYKK